MKPERDLRRIGFARRANADAESDHLSAVLNIAEYSKKRDLNILKGLGYAGAFGYLVTHSSQVHTSLVETVHVSPKFGGVVVAGSVIFSGFNAVIGAASASLDQFTVHHQRRVERATAETARVTAEAGEIPVQPWAADSPPAQVVPHPVEEDI